MVYGSFGVSAQVFSLPAYDVVKLLSYMLNTEVKIFENTHQTQHTVKMANA